METSSLVFHRLDWKTAPVSALRPSLIWGVTGILAYQLFSFGKHTPLGPGLIGFIFPVLLVAAWLSKREGWKSRFFCVGWNCCANL